MATIAVAKIGATLKINGVEYPIYEGDIVNNLVYMDNGVEKTITGAIRVISASTAAQNVDPHTTCPPDPYVHKYITVNGMIIDSSIDKRAVLTRIKTADIVSVERITAADEADGSVVVGVGPQYKQLDAVLAEAEEGTTVKLTAGDYEMPLVVTKNVSIVGTVPGVVLKGQINIAAPAAAVPAALAASNETPAPTGGIKVEISNVKLTGDATIVIGDGVDEFVMTNCTFGSHNLTAKAYPIKICTKDTQTPMLVKIDGNVFEAQNEFSYNLMEIYANLKDGSSISGNKFMDACCTHNQINLYGLDPNANITIENNHAAYSGNMVRIGFIGTPVGTVTMAGNSYDRSDADPAWRGLFLVQPFGEKTTSFAGVKIYANKNKIPADDQLGYIYAGGKDTPFTPDNKPAIFVDGVQIVIPNASPTDAPMAIMA